MICVFKQACPRAHPDDASWHRLGSDGAHASLAWRATIADSIELAVSGHYLDTAVIAAGLRLPGIGRISTDIARSEEHTSELQSLMRISYAVFCLKEKTN